MFPFLIRILRFKISFSPPLLICPAFPRRIFCNAAEIDPGRRMIMRRMSPVFFLADGAAEPCPLVPCSFLRSHCLPALGTSKRNRRIIAAHFMIPSVAAATLPGAVDLIYCSRHKHLPAFRAFSLLHPRCHPLPYGFQTVPALRPVPRSPRRSSPDPSRSSATE